MPRHLRSRYIPIHPLLYKYLSLTLTVVQVKIFYIISSYPSKAQFNIISLLKQIFCNGCVFALGFPTKILFAFIIFRYHCTCHVSLIFPNLVIVIVYGGKFHVCC